MKKLLRGFAAVAGLAMLLGLVVPFLMTVAQAATMTFKKNIVITGSGLPPGIIVMSLTACPSGWSEVTAAAGRYLLPVVAGRIPGNTFGTAITAGTENPTIATDPYNVQICGASCHMVSDYPMAATRGDIVPTFYVRLCQYL